MDTVETSIGPNGSQKWGEITRAGFQIVPDALFLKQIDLGIDPTDMLVLLNLNVFWWFKNEPPFPRTNVIAKRIGVTPRTVQRSLQKMEKKGLVRRDDFTDRHGETYPAIYLDGLLTELDELVKKDVALMARVERSAVQKSEGDEIPF